jgi:hypothetical protein
MLLVTLGMCVFLWGLGYKLSQYDLHQRSIHRVPVAKLMSRDEDPNATDSVRLSLVKPASSQQASAYLFVVFMLSFGSIAGLKTAWNRQYFELPKPWCLRSLAILSALYLRPPPVPSEF